jgi:hypothetical protein
MAGPYQSQLGPDVAPTFSGDSGAAGQILGQGLEQAGAKIDNAIHVRRELDRDQQAAQAGVQLAETQTQLDQAAIDARNNAGPAAAGHTDGITQAVDQATQTNLGSIKDPKLREHFAQQYAQLKDRVVSREYGWEAGQRVEFMAQNFKNTTTTLANGVATNPDPDNLEGSLATQRAVLEPMSLPASMKEQLAREGSREIAVSWGNAMVDKDPKLLIKTIDAGQLSPYLTPEDIKSLRNGGHVEIRRQEAALNAQTSRDKATAVENIDLLGKKITELRDYTVSDEAFTQAEAQAKQYGLQGKLIDIANWRDIRDVNRETRTWTPVQWHQAINDLEAKGDKRTAAESLKLSHLHQFGDQAIADFNRDPHHAASLAGDPPPPLGDLSNPDPKAVEQRVTWARAYARSTGLQRIPYLSNDELKVFEDRIKTGPAGALDATAGLKHLFGGSVATELVKQIDPNNKGLQLMAGLPDRSAQLYKRGVEALGSKTVQLGSNDQAQGQEDAQAVKDIFDKYRGAIPIDMQGAVMDAARGIAAGQSAEFGKSAPTGDELKTVFEYAMQRAGGRRGVVSDWNAPGGYAEWHGTYAWLPQEMSSNEFVRRLSRANPATWIKAAGGSAPYYRGSDGKLAPLSQSMMGHLHEYQLQTVSPGVYSLIAPDKKPVAGKDGTPWQFDIRNLR